MHMNDYQEETAKTAVYPKETALGYLTLGLVNESGEVAGKVKKFLRGDYGLTTLRDEIEAECGDTLWYMAQLLGLLGIPMHDAAQNNLKKLADRQSRGKLTGNGDKR
jgi:NTP pyrophosphatase (non-canonical NTP hydrolase)